MIWKNRKVRGPKWNSQFLAYPIKLSTTERINTYINVFRNKYKIECSFSGPKFWYNCIILLWQYHKHPYFDSFFFKKLELILFKFFIKHTKNAEKVRNLFLNHRSKLPAKKKNALMGVFYLLIFKTFLMFTFEFVSSRRCI